MTEEMDGTDGASWQTAEGHWINQSITVA